MCCFVILLWLSTIGAAFALGKLSSARLRKFDSNDETQTVELWMSPTGKVIHTSPECGYLRNSLSKLITIKVCDQCSNEATLRLARKHD